MTKNEQIAAQEASDHRAEVGFLGEEREMTSDDYTRRAEEVLGADYVELLRMNATEEDVLVSSVDCATDDCNVCIFRDVCVAGCGAAPGEDA